MLRKVYPHPLLTLLLVLIWMLLVNNLKLGSLVFAIILGTIVPQITKAYWPHERHIRHPIAALGYILIVAWDIVTASFTVARQVLLTRNSALQPAWVTIPLDLRTPEAITVLAGSITMTPGTLTADMSSDGTALLVHCLHAPDPDAVRDDIKARYETRLKRIFE